MAASHIDPTTVLTPDLLTAVRERAAALDEQNAFPLSLIHI